MNPACGCSDSGAPLTPQTIDNRPGLSELVYRIGTYASFRETMLDAIAHTPELAGLGSRSDDDHLITLLDLWSAVADVLTFYTERYANEAFLHTATQPESLRRLAALLGYSLRRGIAASADLAFTLDEGKAIQVPVGLRVQSVPGQNELPQTYETLEAATLDARLNRLRVYPKPAPLNPLRAGAMEAVLARRQGPALAANLAPGDQVAVFNNSGLIAPEEKKIQQIRMEDDRVIVRWTQPVQGSSWSTSSSAIKIRRKVQLFGYNLQSRWFHSKEDSTVPGGIRWVFEDISAQFVLPASSTYDLDSKYTDIAAGTLLLFATPTGGSSVSTILRTVTAVSQTPRTLGPLSDTVTRVTLDGAIVAIPDLRTVVVYELTPDDLSFDGSVYGSKLDAGALYLPGILRNDGGLVGVEVGRVAQQTGFSPGVVIHPQDLGRGRKIYLTDAQNAAVSARLHSAPAIEPPGAPAESFVHLVLAIDGDASSLETSSAVLRGNVVAAGHGETVRTEVVGSGNASRTLQSFTLQKQPVTYRRGTGAKGAVSSLEVRVNGLLWQEVAGLYGQPPEAQVFSASLADDLKTVLQFGDSRIGGSVVPTGSGNVAATYRIGSGLAGRVSANALTTLLDRLQGLSAVTNPRAAEGGADAESAQAIRKSAPRTVRTFARAVSLQDFEDLITESGEVAKAEAIWIWDGFSHALHLTVAGQGGGVFADPAALAAVLDESRDPNQRLLASNYRPVPVRVESSIRVSPREIADDVLAGAREALLQALSFDALNLGQSIHLSAVYAVLQAAPGVMAVDIDLFGFRRPEGMGNAAFNLWLDQRGVLRLADGSVAPVQEHLRIFPARPDPAAPGKVFPAELATVHTPALDVLIAVKAG